MENCIEQYQAKDGGVTLHTWTDVQGWQEGHVSIAEVPSTPVPTWVQKILRRKKNFTAKEG